MVRGGTPPEVTEVHSKFTLSILIGFPVAGGLTVRGYPFIWVDIGSSVTFHPLFQILTVKIRLLSEPKWQKSIPFFRPVGNTNLTFKATWVVRSITNKQTTSFIYTRSRLKAKGLLVGSCF